MKKKIISLLLAVSILLLPLTGFAEEDVTGLDDVDSGEDFSAMGIDMFAAVPTYPPKVVADNHNLMLRADGRLFGWGDNTYGQLGLGGSAETKYYEPTEIKFFADNGLKIRDIFVVEDASYALCSNGELYSCGKGSNGRLGLDSTVGQITWTLIPGSQALRIEKLYTGKEFVLAETANNEIYGWGRNNYGQVGNGTKVDVQKPVKIMGSADVKQLTVGSDFVHLWKQDNSYYVWGNTSDGRYGFNTGTIAPSNEVFNSGTCSHVNVTTAYPYWTDSNCTFQQNYTRLTTTCDGKFPTTIATYDGIKGGNQQITAKEFLQPQQIVMTAGRLFSNMESIATDWNLGISGTVTNNVMSFSSTSPVHPHAHSSPAGPWRTCTYPYGRGYIGYLGCVRIPVYSLSLHGFRGYVRRYL